MNRCLFAGLLLLPAAAVLAQTPDCQRLKADNAALTEQVTAYEARLGIGGGGATVEDGDPSLKIRFVSCKASQATHRAVLTFLVLNAGPAQVLQVQPLTTQDHPSQVVDEGGQAYAASSSYYPTVGASPLKGVVPPNVPLRCTVTLLDVARPVTYLNAAVLSFQKLLPNLTGTGKPEDYFQANIRHVPVTWGP